MPKLDNPLPKRDYDLPDMSDRGQKHHVSYSELSVFRECPLKWLARYYWRLEPAARILRLDRGSAWHSMLEAHYDAIQAGANKAEARNIVLAALNDYDRSIGGMEAGEFETLVWMYDGHVAVYGSDHRYQVVATEQAFEFPMPVDGAPELTIVGKIDLETIDLEKDTRQVWDHKSASKRDLSKDGFKGEMLLEDQFVLYAKAKQLAGEPVDAVIYNAARTDRLKRAMTMEERFVRVRQPYSEAALDVVWNDNVAAATALVAMWNDPSRVYSVPNPKQCSWKCDFKNVHLDARHTGRPFVEIAIDFGFQFKPKRDESGAELEAPAPSGEEESGW